ncbi:MAG: tetratricopeptide repeat protein, partial [Xenococcus sp. (in: cyanobacteria)]
MMKLTRSLDSALCLGLLTLTLPIAIPALAEPSSLVTQIEQSSNSFNLLEQGRMAYEAGRYLEAVTVWQQAEQEFQKSSDSLNRALTLNYLSLAYQELGQWQEAKQAISQSLELLQEQTEDSNEAVLAQALNTQGSLQLATGEAELALETWQQAASYYKNTQDVMGVMGSQINQAQALQTLGLYRRSQKLLEEIAQELEQQSDPLLQALGFRSLGTTLQTIGNLERSQELLQKSLTLTQELNLPEDTSATLLSLGNTARLLENQQEAIAFYEQAAATTVHPLTRLEAQTNLLGSLVVTEQWQATNALLPQIQTSLAQLGISTLALTEDNQKISRNTQSELQRRTSSPAIERYPITSTSRPLIYAQVNLAKNLINLQASQSSSFEFTEPIQDLLQETLRQTKELGDQRSQSYVLGTLGHYYEQQKQWKTAQKYTEQALNLGEILNATDIAYQWQWQLGRLLQAQGDKQGAIAPYTEAVKHLQSLRGSLVAVNPDAQFSFRESVEPVYRELVGLLLDVNPSQAELEQAREVIESLQLAELENFFQEAC